MEMILMPISRTSILSEIEQGKPISARTRAYYRRRLQNRIHRLILAAFRQQQKETGLNQKQLAERIGKDKSKVNYWLGVPSNLTLETISDLLLGMGVDLDDPSVTSIANLISARDALTITATPKPPRTNLLAMYKNFNSLKERERGPSERSLSPMQPLSPSPGVAA
jgi:transcriptional regulator with XRE-family HTH domain